jgi:hypothetical protein
MCRDPNTVAAIRSTGWEMSELFASSITVYKMLALSRAGIGSLSREKGNRGNSLMPKQKNEAQILRSAATQLGLDVSKYATRAANGYLWCSLKQHWWRPAKKHKRRRVSVWCGKCEWVYRKGLKGKLA